MLSATLYSNPLNRNSSDRLLDVVFTAASKQVDFPIDLILIVDRSGSMEDTIEQVKETLLVIHRFVTEKCTRQVNLNLISFATDASVDYPNGDISFVDAVNNILADGVTNMSDALFLAKTIAQKNPDNYKTIIMLSDGMPNRGAAQSVDQLSQLSSEIDRACRQKLTKISIGYGEEYNPKLLAMLGEFSYARNMGDVREIIPCALGRAFTSYGYGGTFNINQLYNRVVIGETSVGSIFNEQVYHLGLAVNLDAIDLSKEISFKYFDLDSEAEIVLTTKINIDQIIPPNVMGMYHEAACARMLERYQTKFVRQTITKDEIILIQDRIMRWFDSPTKDACMQRIEDMMARKSNDHKTIELLCVSTKQRTVKMGDDGHGYTTTSQRVFCDTMNDMY
jgi:hypothetical protein